MPNRRSESTPGRGHPAESPGAFEQWFRKLKWELPHDFLGLDEDASAGIAMDGEPRVLIGVGGRASVIDREGRTVRLASGDTVLIPASCPSPRIDASDEGARLLWVDLPTAPASTRA